MLRLEQDRAALQTKLAEMQLEVHQSSAQSQADSLEISKNLLAVADKTDRLQGRFDGLTTIAIAAFVIILVAAWLWPDGGRELVKGVVTILTAPRRSP